MHPHEEFLELCAAATAGELNAEERARLDAHLADCGECRKVLTEYETAAQSGVAALAGDLASETVNASDDHGWSVASAENAFFKRLDKESASKSQPASQQESKKGQRYSYRPSEMRWREVWMPFAAAILLALALGITAYRRGVKHGTDVARVTNPAVQESVQSLEEQSSDAAHDHAELVAKLNDDERLIENLKHQLDEQMRLVNELRVTSAKNSPTPTTPAPTDERDKQLATAQAKIAELQKTIDEDTARRQEVAVRANTLEMKVGELTQLVREREQALDQKQIDVARQQELLDHDRDIRELMGARDLYVADVHDVAGTGKTDKTYGRVFYTRGKSLIFYAYDLDAQPGLRNASTFQAWGRRGPDKEQAINLGILYEDNASKKRWVLKAEDPKTLADIDAVFVTVEPNGGSHHPSGKQLLFAFLRVNPNHP
jgi:hypothetical protein